MMKNQYFRKDVEKITVLKLFDNNAFSMNQL